jgi:hypothetical protein
MRHAPPGGYKIQSIGAKANMAQSRLTRHIKQRTSLGAGRDSLRNSDNYWVLQTIVMSVVQGTCLRVPSVPLSLYQLEVIAIIDEFQMNIR